MKRMETKRRSIAKSLSWRFLAILITGTVAYWITGEATFAIEIGLLDTGIKLFIYYAHERAWQRIRFGMPPDKPNYQI